MAVMTQEQRPLSWLERTIDLSRVNWYALAFLSVVALSVLAHLWGLERMAMHHDESIHAWSSWKFYSGTGSFTCAGGRQAMTYCYDPVYHGPSLYIFTLVAYFLFGDGDWQARLPMAVSGILMVASAWWLRPYLGNRGALLCAILLAFTPSLLYYTRFARHDGLMVLFELWIVIGFFRYIDTGRARWLYLLAAATALAIATHELYYILGFIFGWFLIIRLAYELAPRAWLLIGLGAMLGISLLVELLIISGLWYGRLTPTLRADGLALLFMNVALSGLLMLRVLDPSRLVAERFRATWRDERYVFLIAGLILASIYVLMYSTFFADPRGIIDGLYRGIEYWLGSQQEFKRGDQPWYYYLILMPLYEPLAFFGSLLTALFLFGRGLTMDVGRSLRLPKRPVRGVRARKQSDVLTFESTDTSTLPDPEAQPERADELPMPKSGMHDRPIVELFPIFLVFWFLGALVIFSWAGEKMPWLNTHIALPGYILVAWALGKLLDGIPWRGAEGARHVLVPTMFLLALVALAVAIWRFGSATPDQTGLSNAAQGLLPLVIAGALLFGAVSIGWRSGLRVLLSLAALTVALVLGVYTIRASWMVVYNHPDTPIEPLIYTQTSPDVPIIVRELHEISVAQTRNTRTPGDPVGGLTMPVIMDAGDPQNGGEGSLAWPFQWYLRHFQRVEYRDANFFRSATPDSFLVEPAIPGGEKQLAPVVMISRQNVSDSLRDVLNQNYTRRYDTKLNWWFPEGNKCNPEAPGYKRFYYNTLTRADALADCPGLDPEQVPGILAPFLWVFDRTHATERWQYLIYRELPADLPIFGREMQVWVRRDLVGGPATDGGTLLPPPQAGTPIRLAADLSFSAPGRLGKPTGMAIDAQGRVYVIDTMSSQIVVFGPDGQVQRTIGSFGSENGQFYEPSSLAIDAQGNLYVTDTWNARVVKLDPQGNALMQWGIGRETFDGGRRATSTGGTLDANAADPLGFYGPRGIAVDAQGRVYITDTGNNRVVVTDSAGSFLYQWGYAGSAPGAFNEPIGIGVDADGNVYVGDTWNQRIQVFAPGANGQVDPLPIRSIPIDGWESGTYLDPFIAVASTGDLLVSIPGRDLLAFIDRNGNEWFRWGGAGNDLSGIRNPTGVTFGADGAMFAVDRGNQRIMRFAFPIPNRP